MCSAMAITCPSRAQDRFESIPSPNPSAPKPIPHPPVVRHRPTVSVMPEPPVPTVPRSITPAPRPQPPSYSEASLLGHWCAAGIRFTLTPSEWRYELTDGQNAVFRVIGIQSRAGTASVTFQDQKNGVTVNEFRQIDNNTIIQLRGRNSNEQNWYSYNRNFKRC